MKIPPDLRVAISNSRLFPLLAEARFQMRCARARMRSPTRRRVHAYCISLGKTGTHSIATMFDGPLRTHHEPDGHYLLTLLNGRFLRPDSDAARVRFLRRRDRAWRLELESSAILTELIPDLADLFPGARFLFPVRDPFTWLDSSINQMLLTRRLGFEPVWAAHLLRLLGHPATQPDRAEQILAELELPTLTGFLRHYRWAFETVEGSVPKDRLLTFRTFDISTEGARIGAFLDPDDPVPFNPKRTHVHKMPDKHHVLSRIDPDYLDERVHEICGPQLGRYFPEISSVRDVRLSTPDPGAR